eukprot:scaffold38621_cov81-Phaeocystis_antarctica.AAC.5
MAWNPGRRRRRQRRRRYRSLCTDAVHATQSLSGGDNLRNERAYKNLQSSVLYTRLAQVCEAENRAPHSHQEVAERPRLCHDEAQHEDGVDAEEVDGVALGRCVATQREDDHVRGEGEREEEVGDATVLTNARDDRRAATDGHVRGEGTASADEVHEQRRAEAGGECHLGALRGSALAALGDGGVSDEVPCGVAPGDKREAE